MMRIAVILFLAVGVFSCDEKDKELSANDIIDRAIENSCQGNCDRATIEFTFRDRCYISKRNSGDFEFQRITTDSNGITKDVLTNSGFKRFRNDTLIQLPDSTAIKFGNSVNSVHYFAQLPYGLNDPAVNKELLGEDTISDNEYFEIGVTFEEEGGGTDFEDVFVYWIHKENFTIDYLAYQYSVNGGGMRFREAYNERTIEGIRFADYNNYKQEDLNIELKDLDDLFMAGKLKLLSKIETESVMVKLK